MKYVKNLYILCAAAVFTVAACSKKLDTIPTESISNEAALATTSDVKIAMVGAYDDLGNAYLYGGDIFILGDLMAATTEINWSGTFGAMTQVYNKAIPVDNSYIANVWLSGYRAINDVNNVLSALDVIKDEDTRDDMEGQAKFIRGSVLFDLVRVFAKSWNDGNPAANAGVPIVLTPTRSITDSSKVPRATVAAVYAQVISDLTDAETLLPPTNGFYASSLAASAMLARIYLQQGDYAKAAVQANKVIASNAFRLTGTYEAAFPFPGGMAGAVANTTEDVFAMQITSSSGTNDFQTFYSPLGRGDIQIEDAHLNLYEADDDRLNLFYNSGGSVFTGKFDNLYGNVHIIRLAEMYLIRAEANFRQGTAVGAAPVDDINTIRDRANLALYNAADLTLAKILLERKLELAFEGFGLHDAKRLQQSVGNIAWNANNLVFPVPQRERRVNTNLSQNDGYQ
ncbi:tetratricopeptide (TPR) repeat protein [Filimonas zeae]|uniref:Membrane protein n=1 Tax=Filimonas zeae TaxID=1737353 RepID=A0A917IU41_9BACT|nr:RagB/SusD family nutrient uptake outer membrane protein [Filimonas zeae]MDR6339382.1 tetratricopeptide (TPR) repeat protein [Filimonas zeae]GGH63850.1 membrane protein [Filimonas zeae]